MIAALRRLLLHVLLVVIVLVLGFFLGMLVGWLWPTLHLKMGGASAAAPCNISGKPPASCLQRVGFTIAVVVVP